MPADLARTSLGAVAPVADVVRRRLAGAYVVDPWGLDTEVSALTAAAARVRWSIAVRGDAHIPADGSVLLVANQRLASVSPIAAVLELGRRRGRAVRFAGVPPLEPVATAIRRLGGVVERPDEVAGLLRAGEVVLVWCEVLLRGGARVGRVRPELMTPALAEGAPVLPVAIHGNRLGRDLVIEVGPPLDRRRRPVGPLAAVEVADGAREAVQRLLDEASPRRWPYR